MLIWDALYICAIHAIFSTSFMQVVYVNIDTFKSKVRLLASQFEPEFTVKTVLNQDHGGY